MVAYLRVVYCYLSSVFSCFATFCVGQFDSRVMMRAIIAPRLCVQDVLM
jgi:hypothetical protein